MKKKRSSQGSALLLAVIVVLLAAGLGGSFLIVNISNSRTQQNMSDQDELMVMCDAGSREPPAGTHSMFEPAPSLCS